MSGLTVKLRMLGELFSSICIFLTSRNMQQQNLPGTDNLMCVTIVFLKLKFSVVGSTADNLRDAPDTVFSGYPAGRISC
jgi:hypothetical protein